jgi:hypothetical protein
MKTTIRTLIILAVSIVSLFGCSSKKNKSSNTNQNWMYYTMDQYGNCIDTRTYQPVNPQYCSNNQGYSQYSYNQYGQCVDINNGQVVPYEYCQGGGFGGGGGAPGAMPQICVGWYWNQYNQQVYCATGFAGGSSCSGQTLADQYGQWVYCQ